MEIRAWKFLSVVLALASFNLSVAVDYDPELAGTEIHAEKKMFVLGGDNVQIQMRFPKEMETLSLCGRKVMVPCSKPRKLMYDVDDYVDPSSNVPLPRLRHETP